jgi:DNA-3-methyladenine glycosylase II
MARMGRWDQAIDHLRTLDPRWAERIDRVGPCRLRPRRDRFETLVRAIIGQQISTRAADAITERLRARTGGSFVASALLEIGPNELRHVGLSGMKVQYLLSLADAVATGRLPLQRIGRLGDAAIIERLTAVRGIGTWTAEMFLIFALNRPDVLPIDDLGVRVGIRDHYGLVETPKPRACIPLAEPWRPFRSVASWYLWRGRDTARTAAPITTPAQGANDV